MFILVTFGARRIITRYRTQVLWSQLGEVEPFRWQVDHRTNILATAIGLVVVILGLVVVVRNPMDLDADMRVIIAAGGFATGVVYFALGRSLAIIRYCWVGSIGGQFSLVLMVLPLNRSLSWLAFGSTWVMILLIPGACAFRNTRIRLRKV